MLSSEYFIPRATYDFPVMHGLYWLLRIAVPKRVSIMALLRPFSYRTGSDSNADVEPK